MFGEVFSYLHAENSADNFMITTADCFMPVSNDYKKSAWVVSQDNYVSQHDLCTSTPRKGNSVFKRIQNT